MKLGCLLKGDDIECGPDEQSVVPGIYLAGDATKDAKLVIIAAAEGAKAAFAINAALSNEEILT